LPVGAAVIVLSALIGCAHAEMADTETEYRSDQLPWFLSERLVNLFEPGEHLVTKANGEVDVFEYQLFKPVARSADERFPLIVWIHGHGDDERLHRNTGQLKYTELLIFKCLDSLIFEDATHGEPYPFYLLALQCPKDSSWFPAGIAADEDVRVNPGAAIVSLLKQLYSKHPIDQNRVSLVGISSGGSACWEMARRYPGQFCAMVPFSSGHPGPIDPVHCFADLSIWAFHCTGDPRAPIVNVRNMVTAIQKAGGTAHLSEIPVDSHDSWTPASEHWDVLDWLLSQQRGHEGSVEFGGTPFAYTWLGLRLPTIRVFLANNFDHILLIALVVVILTLYYREYSRRRKGPDDGHALTIPLAESSCAARVVSPRIHLFALGGLALATIVFLVNWLLLQPSVTIIQ
jgi:predicted esterase